MIEAIALAGTLVLAGERSLLHVPVPEEVRVQAITRTDNEREWPFTVDEGNLTCVWSIGEKLVFFFEGHPHGDSEEDFEARGVIISVNPLELTIGNIANRALFAPVTDVADLVRRVAPYAEIGRRLCDQPPGAVIRHGEL